VKNPSPHTVPSAQVVGEGDATAVSGGLAAKGRWRKPAVKQMCNLVDSTGLPMKPQPGAAWIVYAPEGSVVTAS
jgi:Protein of unknown function (DUF3048) C-terminal domain